MRLGRVIYRYRTMSDVSIRDLAKEVGISPATLHRIETGGAVDGSTLALLLIWLIGQP